MSFSHIELSDGNLQYKKTGTVMQRVTVPRFLAYFYVLINQLGSAPCIRHPGKSLLHRRWQAANR